MPRNKHNKDKIAVQPNDEAKKTSPTPKTSGSPSNSVLQASKKRKSPEGANYQNNNQRLPKLDPAQVKQLLAEYKTMVVVVGFCALIIGVAIGIYVTNEGARNIVKEQVSIAVDEAYKIRDAIQERTTSLGISEDLVIPVRDMWNDSALQDLLSYVHIPQIQEWNLGKVFSSPESLSPGTIHRNRDKKPKYPVVIIPGFITTRLESWGSDPCVKDYLHKCVWGELSMIQLMLTNASCWVRHMSLNPKTGRDPGDEGGIKLRPTEELHGIDFLFPGFWVWGKLIQNLALVGYDSNMIYAAAYDWRMSPQNTEERDRFFTKLKSRIELMFDTSEEKAVVLCHSMGSPYFYFFLKWVQNKEADWVDKYLHSVVHIGGALLGASKGLSAMISGEMKDSVELEPVRAYIADNVISAVDRRNLLRSWNSLGSLVPKGGDYVWSVKHKHKPTKHSEQDNKAPDDIYSNDYETNSYANILEFMGGSPKNMSSEEAMDFLFKEMETTEDGNSISQNLQKWFSLGMVTQESEFRQEKKFWSNPLESQLPVAPQLSTFCLYGVGKPTERAYYYYDKDSNYTGALPLPGIQYAIATGTPKKGVRFTEGDGTVPLVSLGYMCTDAWRRKLFNPSESPVYTREYLHKPWSPIKDPRGGPETGDHVDILGNHELLGDIIEIVTGGTDAHKDRVFSEIVEISKTISSRAGLEEQITYPEKLKPAKK